MLGVDERQGDERAAVFGPAGEHRKLVEADIVGDDVHDRPGRTTSEPDAQQFPSAGVARPQTFPSVGGSSVSARCTTSLTSACGRVPKASSARRAVPNRFVTSGNALPVDAGEEQRRSARGNHTAMDFGDLEIGVDGRGDDREVPVALQPVEELTKVGEAAAHSPRSLPAPRRASASPVRR